MSHCSAGGIVESAAGGMPVYATHTARKFYAPRIRPERTASVELARSVPQAGLVGLGQSATRSRPDTAR